ncbi:peptidase, S54 family [Dictyocaulus viviparus]|uniref:Peptidase, S54 family n=1 Tax=Dictyocaulus viviparus TaxID=29172 RepID=A0A0D8XL41_DICVI|nr:peptidase, S54 family [Dictyocaulus viviparus]
MSRGQSQHGIKMLNIVAYTIHPIMTNECSFYIHLTHTYDMNLRISLSSNNMSPYMHESTTPAPVIRSLSQASEPCARLRAERRESAARLAYGTAANLAKRGLVSAHRMHRVRLSSRQSFDLEFSESEQASSPASIGSEKNGENFQRRISSTIEEELLSESATHQEPIGSIFKLNLLSGTKSVDEEEDEVKKSLPCDTANEGSFVQSKPLNAASRKKLLAHESIEADDLFFAFPIGEDRTQRRPLQVSVRNRTPATAMSLPKLPIMSTKSGNHSDRRIETYHMDSGDGRLNIRIGRMSLEPLTEENRLESNQPSRPLLESAVFSNQAIRYPLLKQASVMEISKKDAVDEVLGNLGRHSSRLFLPRYKRYRGLGALSSFYDGSLHHEKIDALAPEVREIIERGSDERPFFTWWITLVQVLVCIVSLMFYGIGPIGWERVEMKDEVVDVSLIMRQVSYFEPVNHWIGPRFADLIRLGAKYSPCMRRESDLWKLIHEERRKENVTGCCVFNDRTGCYQTRQSSCPRSLATWLKWSSPVLSSTFIGSNMESLIANKSNSVVLHHHRTLPFTVYGHSWRTAGSVCGQDPDFCKRPSSVKPYEWPDDLTKWPICSENRQGGFLPPHMTCQVTGRPCCIQMQGQCRIATREYCNFVKGHFHENATLCSQVNCFSNICGMLPFLWKDNPDQFYRMFLSLFLHAGVIHCAFTVFVQMWLMLDLEMLIGWKRMAILYIGSGIGGNFASAIFVPYSPEVGPSGSHLGIMAALVVDLHHHRGIIVRPQRELMKHVLTVFLLFLTGLLPWIDNWAHLFGFIFGLLITIVIFPYLDFNSNDKPKFGCRSTLSRRHIAIVVALILCVFLYSILGYIYYHMVEVKCSWCQYFNCINIKYITGSDHFCDNTGQKLSQWLPI